MRRLPCRLVQSFKPAREPASGISYVSLPCLGRRKPACACSALSLSVERRGPDGAAGGDHRGAARNAAKPAARKPAVRSSARTPAEAAVGHARAGGLANRGHYPERGAREALSGADRPDRDDDRSQPVRQPAGILVADILSESPGISVKQGNGPRDIGISIRGSNARNGFGIRNIVIFDDGFPVTQPDGLSRSDLIDPRAYGAIDVISGPSSALYGNYATGGALNFRTRPGGTIDGVEYGVDGGSFGYLNNYLARARRSAISNPRCLPATRAATASSEQLVQHPDGQFSWHAAGNARRPLHRQVHQQRSDTRLPIRLSLNQFYQNPFQQGATTAGVAGCGTVTLFNNGFNGARTTTKRRCRRALAATIAGRSSADDGSTISTTRRPGETNSFSTTGTSTSRPERPARSVTFPRTTI